MSLPENFLQFRNWTNKPVVLENQEKIKSGEAIQKQENQNILKNPYLLTKNMQKANLIHPLLTDNKNTSSLIISSFPIQLIKQNPLISLNCDFGKLIKLNFTKK